MHETTALLNHFYQKLHNVCILSYHVGTYILMFLLGPSLIAALQY